MQVVEQPCGSGSPPGRSQPLTWALLISVFWSALSNRRIDQQHRILYMYIFLCNSAYQKNQFWEAYLLWHTAQHNTVFRYSHTCNCRLTSWIHLCTGMGGRVLYKWLEECPTPTAEYTYSLLYCTCIVHIAPPNGSRLDSRGPLFRPAAGAKEPTFNCFEKLPKSSPRTSRTSRTVFLIELSKLLVSINFDIFFTTVCIEHDYMDGDNIVNQLSRSFYNSAVEICSVQYCNYLSM